MIEKYTNANLCYARRSSTGIEILEKKHFYTAPGQVAVFVNMHTGNPVVLRSKEASKGILNNILGVYQELFRTHQSTLSFIRTDLSPVEKRDLMCCFLPALAPAVQQTLTRTNGYTSNTIWSLIQEEVNFNLNWRKIWNPKQIVFTVPGQQPGLL